MDRPYRRYQLACGGLLDQIPGGAGFEYLEDVFLVVVHRKGEHLHVRVKSLYLPCRLKAVQYGHGDIHYNDVRGKLLGLFDRFAPVLGLSDDLKAVLRLQEGAEPLPENRMVVHNQYPYVSLPCGSPFISQVSRNLLWSL